MTNEERKGTIQFINLVFALRNSKEFFKGTGDFDFRDWREYKLVKVLQYRTEKRYRPDLKPNNDHNFNWDKVNYILYNQDFGIELKHKNNEKNNCTKGKG